MTNIVDEDSQAVLNVHCSTNREGSDTAFAEQIARRNACDLRSLAANKGYDKQSLVRSPARIVSTTETVLLEAYEISAEKNHDVYDSFIIALARVYDGDYLISPSVFS